jgi:hypothetical protein
MENNYQRRSERQQKNNEMISFITVVGIILFAFVLLVIKLEQLSN